MQMPPFLKPLDLDSERESIISAFSTKLKSEKKLDYEPLIGDDYNILISCILYRLNLKINEINSIIANNYLEYSSGEYLDELVKLLDLKRFVGSPPLAKAHIKVKDNTFLSKGTKFVSQDGTNAYALKDYELLPNISNEVILQGDKEGDWETTILEIKNPLILDINMLSEFIIYEKGEDDERLKKRFINALSSFSTAGSKASYTHYAKVEGVAKVKVFSPQSGIVKIMYYGDNEGSEELIRQNVKDNIPLTDKVIIEKIEPTIIDLNITLTLNKEAEYGIIQAVIISQIENFFASLEIGQSVPLNKVISLCFVDKNVINAEVESFENISENSIYELNSIHIKKKQ